MSEHHIWQTQAQNALENKAAGLTEKERKTYHIEFITRAILKVPEHTTTDLQLEEFKKDTETLISAIPAKDDLQKLSAKDFARKLSIYKAMLIKQYKIVTKDYYTGIWMSIGIAIGVSFGVVMKNLALGIAIGLGVGLAIGGGLNAKAEREGKVI
ncbi:MAG: hypothetical protein V4594_09625 [Bacteroidota bacterium]